MDRMNRKKILASVLLGIICVVANLLIVFNDRKLILNDYTMNITMEIDSNVLLFKKQLYQGLLYGG